MPGPDDTVLDGLALVECAHRGDPDGAMVLLANCDAEAVAAFLAMLVADLIERWVELDDVEDAFARMRQHYAT